MSSHSSHTSMPRRRRFLSAALAILAATSMIGVYAAFTESISTQTQNITTGSGSLVLTAGSLRTTLNSSISDLVPGDWVTRPVTITNQANFDLSTVSLSVGDSFPGTAFTSDPEGLKLTVEEESTPGSGSWSTIYGPSAPTGNVIANIGGGVLTAGGSTSLRVTQTFVGPNTSKSLKGAEADLTYVFNGSQRDPHTPPPAYPALITSANPSSFLTFDNTSDLMTDAVGSDFTEYASNGNPLTSVSGLDNAGKAVSLTGSPTVGSGYNAMTNDARYSASAAGVTYEGWVSLTANSQVDINLVNVNMDSAGNGGSSFEIFGGTTGTAMEFQDFGSDAPVVFSLNSYVGAKHYVVFTSNLTNSNKMYVDGALVASSTTPETQALASGPVVGGANAYFQMSAGNTNHYGANTQNITVDDLAVYPSVLTSAQVLAHYNAGK